MVSCARAPLYDHTTPYCCEGHDADLDEDYPLDLLIDRCSVSDDVDQ